MRLELQFFGGGGSSGGNNPKGSAATKAEKSSNNTVTGKSIQNFRETDQKLKFTTSDGQKDTITRTANRTISNGNRKNIPKNKLPKGAERGFTEDVLIKGTNRVGKTYMVQTQYVFYPQQGAFPRMESKTLSIKEMKNTESTKKKKK